MNHSNEELSTNEIENRELLYSLYIEIMEEIHNKKINIDNEEYIKKIATISVSTLIFYIKGNNKSNQFRIKITSHSSVHIPDREKE